MAIVAHEPPANAGQVLCHTARQQQQAYILVTAYVAILQVAAPQASQAAGWI